MILQKMVQDFAGNEALETPEDIPFRGAFGAASRDMVDGGYVPSQADENNAEESGIGLSMATPEVAMMIRYAA